MAVGANESLQSCTCLKRRCLGALSFHANVKGRLISLSDGGRRATRDQLSFCHGLVFSSRPVKTRERVRLRVERSQGVWHGSLRVGFTNVPPEETTLPPLAIPDLTNCPLYTATVVPEEMCNSGSEFKFWIDKKGDLCIRGSAGSIYQKSSLDISKPIWAIIDVYGQTSTVLLLGSKKKGFFRSHKSCPAPAVKYPECVRHNEDNSKEILNTLTKQTSILEHKNLKNHDPKDTGLEASDVEECVVCFSDVANTSFSCGHKCVCAKCALKVYNMFGTCPLCRQFLLPIKVS